ncbi:CTP synthase ura7 [Balamuthia mandrillaris]
MKYVLVTGGVLSGLGKGVMASSTGMIMRSLGFNVTAIKIDPYINIDAGTMSPFEHGEVFVLDDGGEADLDLGNYERFMDITLTRDHNITTGKIYNHVIEKERKGEYLGKTVQVVPHITNAIQDWVQRVAALCVDGSGQAPELCVIELGGTIGDIEQGPFIEAMRQFQFRVGKGNFCHIHVSLVPVVGAVGEQKTKPTQASVRELRALGFSPDLVVCRSSQPLAPDVRQKLGFFCHVAEDNVISVHDVSNLYRVPLLLQAQGVPMKILQKLELYTPRKVPKLLKWNKLADLVDQLNAGDLSQQVHIAMVGKYTGLTDSYLSVIKALQHAALSASRKLVIDWIESLYLEPQYAHDSNERERHEEAWAKLKGADGVLVPGGFGDRGTEGMIIAARYAREHKVPYLGICLGMQIAVVEYARHIVGWENASSEEFTALKQEGSSSCVSSTPTEEQQQKKKEVDDYSDLIFYMPEVSKTHMGGTMRLGKRRTELNTPDCLSARLYQRTDYVDERHRHRYEVNPKYVQSLQDAGLSFVGFGDNGQRAEIVELKGHPFFVGTQFHPEFMTRPTRPCPLFVGLLLAASGQLQDWLDKKEKPSHNVLSPLFQRNKVPDGETEQS